MLNNPTSNNRFNLRMIEIYIQQHDVWIALHVTFFESLLQKQQHFKTKLFKKIQLVLRIVFAIHAKSCRLQLTDRGQQYRHFEQCACWQWRAKRQKQLPKHE